MRRKIVGVSIAKRLSRDQRVRVLDLIDSVCKVALSSLKIADLTHRPSRLSKADVETVPCYKRDLVMSMYVVRL